MVDSVAVEWFGQASAGRSHEPEDVAVAFGNQLAYYKGNRFSDALSDLMRRASTEGASSSDPVLGFLKQYEPIFREFDQIFRGERASKELLAVFNQQLAQGLYIAQTRSDIQLPATQFIQTIRAMDSAQIPLGVACNIIVSGARGQAGLMEIFDRNGYTVTVPDPDTVEEVALWDVVGNTDFVAIREATQGDRSRDVLLLIDAKSDSRPRNIWESRDYEYAVARTDDRRRSTWNSVVASALAHVGKEKTNDTVFAHLTVSLHSNAMDDLGRITSNVDNQLIHSLEKKLGI